MNDALLNPRNSLQSIETTDESDSFESICGYADEPLVSLVEACKPLINIVPSILTYALIALNETSYQPADDLTSDESASIYLYTMQWKIPLESLETRLNQILSENNREELKPWFKYLKLFLTAVVKLPSIGSRIVWCVGQSNWSRNLTWWRISLTTTSLLNLKTDVNSNENNETSLFSIQSINGRNIQQHSQYQNGKEVLLLPGSQFEVQCVLNSTKNSHIVHLKQKIPDKKLLDPPFHGKSSIRH